MSNKSGVSSAVISLPKGGGALRGIGEKFSPSLHTGTGNFTLPISLPAGRNGFHPQLDLTYSTGNGNGLFGMGWNLSLPGIVRKTSRGVPRYDDSSDVFLLSGSEDLVPLRGQSAAAFSYRPRTEGIFASIVHHKDAANDYWEVRSKDGLVSFYGSSAAAGSDASVIADPLQPARIFAWKLTETQDAFGNKIVYEYTPDSGEDESHRWNQPLLHRVRYADYAEGSRTEFLVSVTFEYEERPDPYSDYRARFEIRTTRRCKAIKIRTHADGERLVSAHLFGYENGVHNGVSLLSRARVVGYDDAGAASRELPPLEFGYTRFRPERCQFSAVDGPDLPPASLARPEYELADLSGDGLPDVLEMNGYVRYWRNLGGGRFDRPREMTDAPAGVRLAAPGVQLIDADGDGRIDLLLSTPNAAGYYPLRSDVSWDRRSFQPYRRAPGFNFEDGEVKLIDLNGDGVTDAIRSGGSFECFLNDPERGWVESFPVGRRGPAEFPDVNFSDPRVKWADMSGDGLQDIVLVYDGSVEYWPHLGYGRWGRRVVMRRCPRLPQNYDPRRVLLGDVNGDGLADLIYVGDSHITLWINQSGNGWSEPITVRGTPPAPEVDAVRVVDLLGSGVGGILWSRDAGVPARGGMFFLDLAGGEKPYLLNEVDNNLGALTRVAYAPSTRFYLADQAHPETRWRTPLPFPVQVVARVEVVDAVSRSKLTTDYQYHHGYWDGVEREFRGFGRVDRRDSESFADFNASGLHAGGSFEPLEERMFSTPVETRTWFHLGAVVREAGGWGEADFSREFWAGDAQALSPLWPTGLSREALRTLSGSVLRTESYALDGSERAARPYAVAEYLYGVREESPPGAGEEKRRRIFFPHLLAARETQWERADDDPLTSFGFNDEYDAHGQPRQRTNVWLPRRSKKRKKITCAVVGEVDVDEARVLATHRRTEYALPDAGVYIHDRVAQVRDFELDAPGGVVEAAPDDVSRVREDQTAAALEVRRRFRQSLGSWRAGQALPSGVRLTGHVLNHYDGAAFEGRPAGELGPYGALARSEALVFTEAELEAVYGNRRPAYLGGGAALPAAAPAGFGGDAGYRLAQTSAAGYHEGYYVDTGRRKFDFQENAPARRRGLTVALQDALGHQTTIEPDAYWLLPASVTDHAGLRSTALYHYRVMQPRSVSDPNGATTSFAYTPLGLVHKQFTQGRNGEGGSEDRPDVEFIYDFQAYERTSREPTPTPIFVQTRRRVWAATDNVSDDTIEFREYSDGFGRLIQKRSQAEELLFGEAGDDVGLLPRPGEGDGPAAGRRVDDCVVVSGWQVYDNKGQVIEKYEPFFASGWGYQAQAEALRGRRLTFHYDPRGRITRTVNPDGSEQRVVFGTPRALDDPNDFSPTPWESYTYDANDLAPLCQHPSERLPNGVPRPLAGDAPAAHHYTPSGVVSDALGRVICRVVRNGPTPASDWFLTRSSYDVRGNLLAVTDALGRAPHRAPAFRYAYDLLNNPLRAESIDAGLRTSVLDAAGNVIESRDSKGSVALRRYDALNRLTHLWACDQAGDSLTLREKIVYGDGGDRHQPPGERDAQRAAYRLGKIHKHYDEAGLLAFDGYDFRGNVLRKRRRVVNDESLAASWKADWSRTDGEGALEDDAYQSDTRYDALSRVVEVSLPEDVNGHRALITPLYNRAGALEKVSLDGAPHVTRIAYNAKGQRVLIAYGNRLMTRYLYDPHTSRLIRLKTERCADPAPADNTWAGAGGLLQELGYAYDLVGNITAIDDRSPDSGIAGTSSGRDRLTRRFEYDPLYRLTKATGRACRNAAAPMPFDDPAVCGAYTHAGGAPTPGQENAPDLVEAYTETYEYDPAGNLLRQRCSSASGGWTRSFGFGGLPPSQWQVAPDNRLTASEQGSESRRYSYDANGNLATQNTERTLSWDHADRLLAFTIRPGGSSPPSVEARYLYDAAGARVKKWVRTGGAGGGESTVYVDGFFERQRWQEDGATKRNDRLHVTDDQSRVATRRVGSRRADDAGPEVQYHLGDHLNSSVVVADETGSWVNREEYKPYGETSFGSFARKRYRFTGKERDAESGLYYYGARYYAPWLARWMSCDPAGPVDGLNLYHFTRGSPVARLDKKGTQSSCTQPRVSGVEPPIERPPATSPPEGGARARPATVRPVRLEDRPDLLYAEGESATFDAMLAEAKAYGVRVAPTDSLGDDNLAAYDDRTNIIWLRTKEFEARTHNYEAKRTLTHELAHFMQNRSFLRQHRTSAERHNALKGQAAGMTVDQFVSYGLQRERVAEKRAWVVHVEAQSTRFLREGKAAEPMQREFIEDTANQRVREFMEQRRSDYETLYRRMYEEYTGGELRPAAAAMTTPSWHKSLRP